MLVDKAAESRLIDTRDCYFKEFLSIIGNALKGDFLSPGYQ